MISVQYKYFILLCLCVIFTASGQDYSKICKNPSAYKGDNHHILWGIYSAANITCKNALNYRQWTAPDCSNNKGGIYLSNIATQCCTDSVMVCSQEYAKMCQVTSDYTPTKEIWEVLGVKYTCDDIVHYYTVSTSGQDSPFKGIDWSKETCET